MKTLSVIVGVHMVVMVAANMYDVISSERQPPAECANGSVHGGVRQADLVRCMPWKDLPAIDLEAVWVNTSIAAEAGNTCAQVCHDFHFCATHASTAWPLCPGATHWILVLLLEFFFSHT